MKLVTKLLRYCPQIGSLWRTKQSTPVPPPLPFKVGVFLLFLQVARTAAQHCVDGMGEENFVADCSITLVHCGRLSRI